MLMRFAFALILGATPTLAAEMAHLPEAPLPPPKMSMPVASPAITQRSLNRCLARDRACHVEPGVGIVMEPKR